MKTPQQIYEFLHSYKLGVLSTINANGEPNAAIVGFGQTKDLQILIGTDNTSRKYLNMLLNKRAAFTVGGATAETVQLEGLARELRPDELGLVRARYWQKNPHAEVHHSNAGERYFIIEPTWVRYTDLRVDPWDITEITNG